MRLMHCIAILLQHFIKGRRDHYIAVHAVYFYSQTDRDTYRYACLNNARNTFRREGSLYVQNRQRRKKERETMTVQTRKHIIRSTNEPKLKK